MWKLKSLHVELLQNKSDQANRLYKLEMFVKLNCSQHSANQEKLILGEKDINYLSRTKPV